MLVTRLALCIAGIIGLLTALCIFSAQIAGAVWLRSDEIAFVSYRAINPDIVLLDVNHDLTRSLTHDGTYNVAPAWSPDGQWIAFASDRDGRRNIYVMDAVGDNLRRMTTTTGFYSLPHWSGDGQRLVFTAMNENPVTSYSIRLDGSDLQPLNTPDLKRGSVTFDPDSKITDVSRSRSPDGNHIAFLSYEDHSWGIYISQKESRTAARLLVQVGIFTEAPVWSPDGKRVAYVGLGDGSADLYVVDVDGEGTPHRLTFSQVIDVSPVWRP